MPRSKVEKIQKSSILEVHLEGAERSMADKTAQKHPRNISGTSQEQPKNNPATAQYITTQEKPRRSPGNPGRTQEQSMNNP